MNTVSPRGGSDSAWPGCLGPCPSLLPCWVHSLWMVFFISSSYVLVPQAQHGNCPVQLWASTSLSPWGRAGGRICAQSFSRVRLFATPWTAAHQAPLSMELSRQEYWSGLPFPPPEDLPDPGINPASPALAGRFFTISHLGNTQGEGCW